MNGEKTRILLCDDHNLMLDGLAALIEREPDLELVGKAQNGIDLLELTAAIKPDLIVTDLSMPILNGLGAIHRLRQEFPNIKVLCLSMHNQIGKVMAALEAGALGYVLKENSGTDLIESIRRVRSGQMFLSGELVPSVLAAYRNNSLNTDDARPEILTLREKEMVQLFSEGHSTQEIADLLCISTKTVATHREHIFKKLDINSIAELTRYAIREGWSSLETKKALTETWRGVRK